MKKTTKAFTLVEIIVVCGVVALFVGTAIMLLSNFRKGYSRSEKSAILLQDTAMFLAQLRSDMNNAVIDPTIPVDKSEKQFDTAPGHLSFQMYDNREGKLVRVVYNLTGHNLTRTIDNGTSRTLVKDNIASLTWETEIESFSGKASGTLRLSLKIDAVLKTRNGNENPFEIHTRIFPARLNRQLNCR
ncbi:MAG: hypothetical protein Kow0029_01450 [Candidatus Rifleibacteriota bacterium]